MTNAILTPVKSWIKAPILSPKGLIARAVIIAIIFAACHLLDWREHTSFLSGTRASPDMSPTICTLLGLAYIATYLSFVIATPILLIAAAIQSLSKLAQRARIYRIITR